MQESSTACDIVYSGESSSLFFVSLKIFYNAATKDSWLLGENALCSSTEFTPDREGGLYGSYPRA